VNDLEEAIESMESALVIVGGFDLDGLTDDQDKWIMSSYRKLQSSIDDLRDAIESIDDGS